MNMEQTTFEELGIGYVERDGLLYPDVETPNEADTGNVGRYGRLWMAFMKENYGYRWRKLVMSGNIIGAAIRVNEEAYDMLDGIVEGYVKKHEEVDRSSTMDMWKLRKQAEMAAEESVLRDVVYRWH